MTDTPQLKPCPFCGQPAVTSHELTTNDVVYCGSPTCPANWSGVDLKTWNTRPTEAALEAENAHLMHASEEVMAENVRLQQRVEELEKAARPPLVPKIDPDLGW